MLSSNRGAPPVTVSDCGVLVDVTNEGDFASALQRLAGDAALCERLATAGPTRVREHFTWEHVARATLAVYASAV